MMARRLEGLREAAAHVRYAYTNVIVDKKVYFIVDDSPQGDLDQDGRPDAPPDIMQLYPDPSPSLVQALTEKTATVDDNPYTDSWGTFISAYAPFFDSQRRFVGTVGLDLELSGLDARLLPLRSAIKRLAIVSVLFAILFGVSIWFMRRQLLQVHERRRAMVADVKWATDFAAEADRREAVLLALWSQQLADPQSPEPSIPSPPTHATDKDYSPVASGLDRIVRRRLSLSNAVPDHRAYAAAVAGTYVALCTHSVQQHARKCELRHWLAELAEQLNKTAMGPEKPITVETDPQLPDHLHFDPIELGLIVEILVRHLSADGTQPVRVALTQQDEEINSVIVCIAFSGPAIPPLELPVLVDVLSRVGSNLLADETATTLAPADLHALALGVVRRWLARLQAKTGSTNGASWSTTGIRLALPKALEQAPLA